MTVDALKKQIKEGNLGSLYYLAGEEQYLLDYYYDRFKDICAPSLPELNFIELDGKKMDFDLLSDACSSYPVMAEKKLVVVVDMETSTLKGTNEKKLLAALEDIAEGVTVLFWDHAKENGKANALDAAIKKLGGNSVRVDRPKPDHSLL